MSEAQSAAMETHPFRAEVDALLRLVTSSLYTNREIFVRELVSNASDALDKARFEALTRSDLRDLDREPKIELHIDKANKTLAIEDTGIGMTKQELSEYLGTIAQSGTLRFLERARAQQAEGKPADVNLIGQFGVGFYSAFMVADRIEVDTLSALPDQEAARWVSTGDGTYAIGPSSRSTRGTRIQLHLKDDAAEFLERWRIESIVKRYSNYVIHPITLNVIGSDDEQPQDGSTGNRINDAVAFWARAPKDLSDDDYATFYRHVMGGFVLPDERPLARLHVSLDAPIQFNALLFVPAHAPTDLFQDDRKALQLYAKRVLVMESCDKLLPAYLRFFRGVVDSEDLPLNVSRETLQEHRSLAAIRRQLTRKALALLTDLASEDSKRYLDVWREFGAVIKEGVHTDSGHQEQIVELLRYPTNTDTDTLVSLADYVANMPADQQAIYYVTGESARDLANGPHLEACRARGFAVLLMTDAIDEWVVQDLKTYKDKPLRNVSQGELELASADSSNDHEAEVAAAIERATSVLGDRVKAVRASKRLTDSAACLVDEEGGLGRNMERILRMTNRSAPPRPRILEINPKHAFIRTLDRIAREQPGDERIATWIELLYDQAHLAEGEVPDPAGTVRRIQAVLDAATRMD